MLTTLQKNILFGLFCSFAVGAASLEAYLIVSLFRQEVSAIKAVSTLLNTTLLVGVGLLFKQMIANTFLRRSAVPPARLHKWSSDRRKILENSIGSGRDLYQIRRDLITNTLTFAEDVLRSWIPGSHFELCVFVDQTQPLLFAYFDSNHDHVARSMVERERDPDFYTRKGYEVTKLLSRPTSKLRILHDTCDPKEKYMFTSIEQRKQLRSSMLLCLDTSTPCAVVISSNEKHAFPERDAEFVSFVRFVGEQVRLDLFEEDFVRRIRQMRPNLFQEKAAAIEDFSQDPAGGISNQYRQDYGERIKR